MNGNSTGVSTSYYVPGVTSGSYQVQVINVNGCSSTSSSFSYQFTGISNTDLSENSIIIYPNPADEIIYIDNKNLKDNVQVKILDLMGRTVFMQELNALNKIDKVILVNVEFLESAIYFIEITEKGKLVQNGKIIIQH